jgi:phosphoribulokinase
MTARRPIVMGIVGDSAAGKTTLTSGIARILGAERVTRVCTDDYHKFDRAERAKLGITALHPDCNYMDIMELQMERLHYGQPILKPVYDHTNGTLVRPEYVVPREFVIIEGLLGFSTPVLRQFIDVKVYLDPPEDVRRVWKVKRDTSKRGYTEEQVLADLIQREPDAAAFIRPQRDCADIVVRFQPPTGTDPRAADARYDVRMVLRPTIEHPDLGYLVDGSAHLDDSVRLELGRDGGRPADFLHISNEVSPSQAVALENAIWQHLPGLRPLAADDFGTYQNGKETRHSDHLALTQLLLAYHLLRRASAPGLMFAAPVAALQRTTRQSSGDDQPDGGPAASLPGSFGDGRTAADRDVEGVDGPPAAPAAVTTSG